MKTSLLLAALLPLAAAAADTPLAVAFWDASGQRFTTDTFGAQLQRAFPESTPTLLLAAASRPDEPRLTEQIGQISALGHDVEELELLVVVSPSSSSATSAYHITPSAAAALLGSDNFLVLLVAADGHVCYRANSPIAAKSMRKQVAACRGSRPNKSFKPNPLRGSA